MSFQLQMEQLPGYLVAKFIGMAAPGEGSRQYELIAEHCNLTNNAKLLIDALRFKVLNPYVADRFLVGERLGIFARYGIKVAFVCRPEQADSLKFAILVAQNRGVKVEVFTDFQAAEEWLFK
ncbi:MAG TPA: hypothetical protein VIC84_08130 [Blastocatellia bacterium]|jgi:hypothetical protein